MARVTLALVFVLASALPAAAWSTRFALASGETPRLRVAPRVQNVLVVVVDTLRADRLRAYDANARVATPAFSALARKGQLFENAYASASWTKPSTATLLTGVLPARHGATSHSRSVDPDVPHLAAMMSEAGYETVAFVANGYVSEGFGFDPGFDEFWNAAQTGRSGGDELVEDLLSWLDAHEGGAPFFAYLHTTDVHAPYEPRRTTVALIDPAPYDGVVDFDASPNLLRSVERSELDLTARDRERLGVLYDAGVADHDELALAPLLAGLSERGLLESTMIVVTADHGEELFDHGSVGHGGSRVYQELIHVPLVIHWPGLPPARVRGTVGLVSMAATITDATGVPTPEGLDGVSLVPTLEGRRTTTGPVLGETGGLFYAVNGQLKLVRSVDSADRWLNLLHDPLELESSSYIGDKEIARLGMALTHLTPPPEEDLSMAEIDRDTLRRLRALGYVE
jgi:arylsulfatase A-like enzyme